MRSCIASPFKFGGASQVPIPLTARMESLNAGNHLSSQSHLSGFLVRPLLHTMKMNSLIKPYIGLESKVITNTPSYSNFDGYMELLCTQLDGSTIDNMYL